MDVLYGILGVLVFVGIIALIVVIHKKRKLKRSSCTGCKKLLEYPKDFKIIAGELQWEKQTKKETKGDFEYEIEYLEYYRIITFDCKCSKCGKEFWFNRRYNLYRSDSKHSQSREQQNSLLKTSIKGDFRDEVFNGKEIEIANIDY